MDINPVLSEIQGLSPAAQQALGMAGHTLPTAAPPTNAPIITPTMKMAAAHPSDAGPAPDLAPIRMPGSDAVPALGAPPSPNVDPSRLLTDQQELGRKIDTGSGISQISGKIQGAMPNHPLLGKILGGAAQGAATLGDIGLSAVAPSLAINLPGTAYHHEMQLNQGSHQVTSDEANAEKEAQTRNLDLQPQLKQAQGALNQEKQDEVEHQHQAVNDIGHSKLQSTLAQHGYAEDEQNPGQLRPLRYEEMSESQQAVHDLKGAQQEEQEATAALKKAQNDPSSPAFKQAQQRIDNAKATRAVAMERLGLSEKQFEMRAHGTENGQALPGSMITDSGQPVGTAFQQNVRPTGTERNKADLANSAASQISDMKEIIHRRPDIFGLGKGQGTDLSVWMGTQDPDAQRFRAARTIAGDHLAGTFGGRSAEALHALDNALGQFKDNPKAAIAGLDQLAGANKSFQKAGTVKTAGSDANTPAPAPKRPDGIPKEAVWNAQGNGGKGSWRMP